MVCEHLELRVGQKGDCCKLPSYLRCVGYLAQGGCRVKLVSLRGVGGGFASSI